MVLVLINLLRPISPYLWFSPQHPPYTTPYHTAQPCETLQRTARSVTRGTSILRRIIIRKLQRDYHFISQHAIHGARSQPYIYRPVLTLGDFFPRIKTISKLLHLLLDHSPKYIVLLYIIVTSIPACPDPSKSSLSTNPQTLRDYLLSVVVCSVNLRRPLVFGPPWSPKDRSVTG
jgi:hypothetical protein